jgi:hypothetical protein
MPQLIAAVLQPKPVRLSDLPVPLPAGVLDVIARALAKPREERFASVTELAQALGPFAPVPARSASGRSRRGIGITAAGTAGAAAAAAARLPVAEPVPAVTPIQHAQSGVTARQPRSSRLPWLFALLVLGLLGYWGVRVYRGELLTLGFGGSGVQAPTSPQPEAHAPAAPIAIEREGNAANSERVLPLGREPGEVPGSSGPGIERAGDVKVRQGEAKAPPAPAGIAGKGRRTASKPAAPAPTLPPESAQPEKPAPPAVRAQPSQRDISDFGGRR